MTNIINKVIKVKDQIEVSRLIEVIEKFCKNQSKFSQEDVEKIFHRANKLYKSYSNSFHKALKDNNQDAINFNFILFAHSTILVSLTLSRMGIYEVEREVIDFFTKSMKKDFNVPGYISNALNNINSENALRLAVVKSDKPSVKAEVQYYLDMVQNHIYHQVDLAKPEKIGEIALFQFVSGNTQRATEYLEMQFQKYSGNTDKMICSEISNNDALFKRSEIAREYKKFVETFIDLKSSPKLLPSVL